MANQIISSGTVRATVGSWSLTSDISFTTDMTGSNIQSEIKDIPSGSWVPLLSQSLTDMRWFVASNEGTASIKIARDNAGTNVLAILQPLDSVQIPWSGSTASFPLWAYAFPSASLLQYFTSES